VLRSPCTDQQRGGGLPSAAILYAFEPVMSVEIHTDETADLALPRGIAAAGQDRLWRSFARSVRANMLAEFGVQFVRIGGFILLARALRPTDFGMLRVLVAIAMVAAMLNTLGISEALIQRQDLTEDHEATAWWIALTSSILGSGLLYLSAPAIAGVMAMRPLAHFLRLLCIPVGLSGVTSIANARLRRRFEFGLLAKADVFAEMAFICVAISLLLLGYPRWSLAGGLAGRYAMQSYITWNADRYLPSRAPKWHAAKDIMGFSLTVWLGRILIAAAGNTDYLMVGRLLGSSALGFYGMAWDLLRFIPDRLNSIAGRVTLPAFCQLQHDSEALSDAYCGFTGYIARIIFPILACAAIAAPQLLGAVYGPQWIPASGPMRMLAAGLALLGLRMAIGAIYFAKGRPSFEIYVHATRLALIIAAVGYFAKDGLLAVSAAMGLVEASVCVVAQALVCRLTEITIKRLSIAIFPGLKTATACGAAAYVAQLATRAMGLHGILVLFPIAISCGAAFLLLEYKVSWRLFMAGINSAKPALSAAADGE